MKIDISPLVNERNDDSATAAFRVISRCPIFNPHPGRPNTLGQNEKGIQVNHTEHPVKTSASRTGSFAAHCALLRTRGIGVPAGRSALALLLVAVALILALAAPALASKAVRGKFCAQVGGGAGQCSTSTGVAVNRTGAGGVAANDFYVTDKGNNRIQEFSAEGAFVRAFGYDVVASGQDNTGANEQQTVTVKAEEGTFSLSLTTGSGSGVVTNGSKTISGVTTNFGSFKVGDVIAGTGIPAGTEITAVEPGTLTISANGNASAIGSAALTATENTGAGGTGTITSGSNTVTGVTTTSGTFAVGQTFTVNSTGIPLNTTITGCSPSCAAPTSLTISANATVTASKTLTTTNIPYNTPATDPGTPGVTDSLQEYLEALPGVGAGKLTVSGGPGSPTGSPPYTVTFTGGGFGGDDLVQMTASAAGLSKGTKTASVATTVAGGGLEVCREGASPADSCKAGTSLASAGAVAGAEGLAIDQVTGNVYVAANTNRRIDVFSAKGAYQGSFGWKVNAASPEEKLQFCTSCQAGTSSTEAGGFSSFSHAALAVDPTSGHLYVGDVGALRINELSLTLNGSKEVTGISFVRAFGGDVLSGGATGTGNVNGNEFVGSFATEVVTSSKAFRVGQAISGEGIAPGTTITQRSIEGGSGGSFLTLKLSKSITEVKSNSSLTAAASPSNVPRNEKQLVAVNASEGTFKLKFSSDPFAAKSAVEATTADLAFNAPCAESDGAGSIEAALKALPNVGNANVQVTGTSGACTVEFKGPRWADTNVSQLVPLASLGGGTATVSTTVEGTSPEICTTATGCWPGATGTEGGWLTASTPTSIAVDSGGFVYAVSAEGTCSPTSPCRVQKFNPDGSFKEAFGPSFGGAAECQLTWTAGAANTEAPVAVAVDPSNQHVFVTRKADATHFELCEFDENGVFKEKSPSKLKEANTTGYLAAAVATSGEIFVNTPINGAQGVVYRFGLASSPGAEIGPASAVGKTVATLNGKVTVPPALEGEGFETTYRFEYSGDGLKWTKAPSPDGTVGSVAGTYPVSVPVSGLQPNLTYRVRLVACTGPCITSGEETFTTLGDTPTISHTNALPVQGTTAKLNGYVNPNNSPTNYRFEWGTTTAYGNQAPDFEPFVGEGGQPISVSATINGLDVSTTYHFRVVATNAFGTTKGPDETFTTNNFPTACANESIRAAQTATALADCRAFEQVSARDKRPIGFVGTFIPTEMAYQSSSDGGSMFYSMVNGLADATAGGELKYIATRGPVGWLSTQATAPALVSPPVNDGSNSEETSRILFNAPDLTCGFMESFEPLSPDTTVEDIEQGVFNLYRRNADGSHTLVSAPTPLNLPQNDGANKYIVDAATEDCSRVLFESPYRLLPAAPASGNGLYEWADGILSLAGIRPDGTVALPTGLAGINQTNGAIAGGAETSFSSMSSDGTRIFFSAVSNQGGDSGKTAVFVRKGGQTLDASQSKTAIANNQHSQFQIASKNGRHVFFTARYGLAPNGSSTGASTCAFASGAGCDLFDYDVDADTLTDLSVDTNPADSAGAGVVGVVDVSDDGSYVYFAARGQLVPNGGNTAAQNLSANSYNVYLAHEGTLAFVGPILGGTSNETGNLTSDLARGYGPWTADATPDGRHLLFVSRANVTGYKPGHNVQEAYRYEASSDTVTCVSCRSDGKESVSGATEEEADRYAPIHSKNTLPAGSNSLFLYRPRSISDDGSRVFFTSPDVLAVGAKQGTGNVYEWEQGVVYLLTAGEGGARPTKDLTLYADSSASGDDVFFVSKSKLALQDFDTTPDLYDARVGGGFPYEPPSQPCDVLAGECSPPAAAPPESEGQAGSEEPVGTGNSPAPKPRAHPRHKRKKHHRAHRAHQGRSANHIGRTGR